MSALTLVLAVSLLTAAPLRDVLATTWDRPFQTTAEVLLYQGNDRGLIESPGGPVLFRCPGISGIRVDGRASGVKALATDLLRVVMPPGRHQVELLRGDPLPAHPPESVGLDPTGKLPDLKPSDELVLRDGTYTDLKLKFEASGTPEHPIVIRPETPGGVTFRRRSQLRVLGNWIVVRGCRFDQCGPDVVVELRGTDCRLTQCQFVGCGNPQTTFQHIVRIGLGSHRSRVDHGFFSNCKSMGVGLHIRANEDYAKHCRIDHNVFRDTYRYWVNGQENIQLGQNQRGESGASSPECRVEGNLFDHAWGDSEIISNKSSDNVITHNVAAWCERSAFVLRGGHGVRFDGNVMIGNGDGLRVMGTHHTIVNNLFLPHDGYGILFESGSADGDLQVASLNSLLAYNTFVNCASGAIGGMAPRDGRPHLATGDRILNNVLMGATSTLLDLTNLRDATVRNNLFRATGGAQTGTLGEHGLEAEPQLTGEGTRLRPAPQSPAVNRGLALLEVPADRWNAPRTVGGQPDLGADEVGGQPAEPVLLPDIPPAPLVAVGLHLGELVYQQDPESPAKDWQTEGASSTAGNAIRLADATAKLARPVPPDLVLSFEYHPEAFAARAELHLLSADGKGYVLSFGGADDEGLPLGTVELRKLGVDSPVADGADPMQYHANYTYQGWLKKTLREETAPPENRWYACRLLKSGGKLLFLIGQAGRAGDGLPSLIFEDTGAVGGPVPEVTSVGLQQHGAASWRALRIWHYSATAGQQPEAPTGLAATTHGGGRLALTWTGGGVGRTDLRYDLQRTPSGVLATGVAATAYDDFQVTPNTSYIYSVVARSLLGPVSPAAELKVTTGTGGPLYLRLADPATELPMEIRTEDGQPYVWAPPGTAGSMKEPPEHGSASYTFSLPQAAEVALWGWVQAIDEGHDSFHAELDQTGSGIWYTGIHLGWGWSKLNSGVKLSAGRHTLTIRQREPGTKLGAVLVSTDLAFAPAGG